jgi:hypothetical protein
MELHKRSPILAADAEKTKGVDDLRRGHVLGHAALDCIFEDSESSWDIHFDCCRLLRADAPG